jgi:hypothetical protein
MLSRLRSGGEIRDEFFLPHPKSLSGREGLKKNCILKSSPLLVLSPTTPRGSITTCIANGDFVIIRDKTGKKVVGDNTNNGMSF